MTKERNFLRIQVSGLKAYFNFVEENESRSLFLNFREKKASFSGEAFEERSPFQDFVISHLQRLENKIDVLIRYLQKERYGKPYQFEASVLDISGGGLRLSTSADCVPGTLMDLCIFPEYGNSPSFYAIGEVQRIERERDQHWLGIKFVEIDEEDRQALLRTIFDLDRKQKRS